MLYVFIFEGFYMFSNLAVLFVEFSIWLMELISIFSKLWRILVLLFLVFGFMVMVVLVLEGGVIGVEVTVMNCGRFFYKKYVINRGNFR